VYSAKGRLFTTDTLDSRGNFDVIDISGTVVSDRSGKVISAPIGSLLVNPDQPNVYTAPNGNIYDNNLMPTAPFVTPNGGIGFNWNGDQLVLFSGGTGNSASEGIFSQNHQDTYFGTLTVAQVPEPIHAGATGTRPFRYGTRAPRTHTLSALSRASEGAAFERRPGRADIRELERTNVRPLSGQKRPVALDFRISPKPTLADGERNRRLSWLVVYGTGAVDSAAVSSARHG
jgi:hypothetical protein